MSLGPVNERLQAGFPGREAAGSEIGQVKASDSPPALGSGGQGSCLQGVVAGPFTRKDMKVSARLRAMVGVVLVDAKEDY